MKHCFDCWVNVMWNHWNSWWRNQRKDQRRGINNIQHVHECWCLMNIICSYWARWWQYYGLPHWNGCCDTIGGLDHCDNPKHWKKKYEHEIIIIIIELTQLWLNCKLYQGLSSYRIKQASRFNWQFKW